MGSIRIPINKSNWFLTGHQGEGRLVSPMDGRMLGFGGGEGSTVQDPLCACGGRAFPRARTPPKQAPLLLPHRLGFPRRVLVPCAAERRRRYTTGPRGGDITVYKAPNLLPRPLRRIDVLVIKPSLRLLIHPLSSLGVNWTITEGRRISQKCR